jgi:hypothetical protein
VRLKTTSSSSAAGTFGLLCSVYRCACTPCRAQGTIWRLHVLRLFCLCAPCAGAQLQLGDLQPSVQLQTQPLTMTVQQVQSEAAMAATGGQWSALLGSPDDRLPELPPDGKRLLWVCNWRLSASRRFELAPSMTVVQAVVSCSQDRRCACCQPVGLSAADEHAGWHWRSEAALALDTPTTRAQ